MFGFCKTISMISIILELVSFSMSVIGGSKRMSLQIFSRFFTAVLFSWL